MISNKPINLENSITTGNQPAVLGASPDIPQSQDYTGSPTSVTASETELVESETTATESPQEVRKTPEQELIDLF